MESRGPEDSKNVKTSQAYFFEGFISFFEDFSLTIIQVNKFIGRLDLGCSHSDYTIMSPLTILSLKVSGPRVQTVPFDKDPLIDAI